MTSSKRPRPVPVPIDHRERVRLTDMRICYVCRAPGPIAEGQAVYDSLLGVVVHLGACNDTTKRLLRTYDRSPRGRFRAVNDVLRLLNAQCESLRDGERA